MHAFIDRLSCHSNRSNAVACTVRLRTVNKLGLKMGARLTSEVKDSVLNQSFPESQQNSSITDASRLIAFGPTIQVQLPSELALKQVRYVQALSRSVC